MASTSDTRRLSWRDPDGFVVSFRGRIVRAVEIGKSEQVRSLLRSAWMQRRMAEGTIPGTAELDVSQTQPMAGPWFWLEHDVLKFPCHAHEITALQLFDAGSLTIDLAIEAAENEWILKDAAAWNVLFSSGRAIFADLLSFDKSRNGRNWPPYGQFVRHFILPLLLYRRLGLTPQDIFLVNRDGVTPEHAHQLLRGFGLTTLTALEFVVLPKVLAPAGGRLIAAQSVERRSTASNDQTDARLMLGTLHHLKSVLNRLRPDKLNPSVWKSYEEDRCHYSAADLLAKKEFVSAGIQEITSVLDLGCNAGEYSLLAADAGKSVVAADADHPALSRLYARIRGRGVAVTPVVLNIGRPTPAIGWQNQEVDSFLERAAGRFDCVFMLGLIHHLLVSERASLDMLVDLLDRLNPKSAILEWVDPKDVRFQQLAGLNGALYNHLTADQFEIAFSKKFRLINKSALPSGSRVMYLWAR